MERTFQVTIPYQAGATPFTLKGLPTNGQRGPLYLKKIEGRVTLVVLSAAVANAMPGRRAWEAIALLKIAPKMGEALVNNLSGFNIREFQRSLYGLPAVDPADIAANSNTTNTQITRWSLSFADERFEQAEEQGVPLAFLGDGNIQVNWQNTTYFGTGNTIQNTTKLDVTFTYDEEIATERSGARVVYEAIGVSKLLADAIPGGCVTDLLISQVDGSTTFTNNSFAQIGIDKDGDPYHNSVEPDLLIQAANTSLCFSSAGFFNFTGGTNPDSVPLVWPKSEGSNMSDTVIADGRVGVNFYKGSAPPALSSVVYLVRRILDVDDGDTARQVATATGKDEATIRLGINLASKLPAEKSHGLIKVVTANAVPLHGTKGTIYGRFLPRHVNTVALHAVASAAVQKANA